MDIFNNREYFIHTYIYIMLTDSRSRLIDTRNRNRTDTSDRLIFSCLLLSGTRCGRSTRSQCCLCRKGYGFCGLKKMKHIFIFVQIRRICSRRFRKPDVSVFQSANFLVYIYLILAVRLFFFFSGHFQ